MVRGWTKGAGVPTVPPPQDPGNQHTHVSLNTAIIMLKVVWIHGRTDIYSSIISAHNAHERLCFLL